MYFNNLFDREYFWGLLKQRLIAKHIATAVLLEINTSRYIWLTYQ